jgi:hypothetical protein
MRDISAPKRSITVLPEQQQSFLVSRPFIDDDQQRPTMSQTSIHTTLSIEDA